MADTINLTSGDDTLLAYDQFDPIYAQANEINGLAGNDTIILDVDDDGQADTVNGGDGNDLILFLLDGDVGNGGAGNDTITTDTQLGDESTLNGGDGADILLGYEIPAANTPYSYFTTGDQLNGGAGADTLQGNHADVLIGGTGADMFRFIRTADLDGDEIIVVWDWQDGIDTIGQGAVDLPDAQATTTYVYGGVTYSGLEAQWDAVSVFSDLRVFFVGKTTDLTSSDITVIA